MVRVRQYLFCWGISSMEAIHICNFLSMNTAQRGLSHLSPYTMAEDRIGPCHGCKLSPDCLNSLRTWGNFRPGLGLPWKWVSTLLGQHSYHWTILDRFWGYMLSRNAFLLLVWSGCAKISDSARRKGLALPPWEEQAQANLPSRGFTQRLWP